MNRNDLASRHLGLVHALCKRFTGKGIEYEELYAAGCLGLTKALNNFDESRGLQFSTYAVPVILGELRRLFRDGGSVRVSRRLRELSMKINRLRDGYISKHGEEPGISYLSQALSVSDEEICEALNSARTPLSLTADSGEDGDSQTDIPVPDMQEEIAERLSLKAALDGLEERDKKIINLRYFQSKTQVETAKLLSLTQVQVSRREKKILGEIRRLMSG